MVTVPNDVSALAQYEHHTIINKSFLLSLCIGLFLCQCECTIYEMLNPLTKIM